MAKPRSQFAAVGQFTERIPILLLAGWAILYLPRPFVLGLYVDDWWYLLEPLHATAAFSLDRLHYFVGFATGYGPRPLQGLTAFLVTSIAGASPKALQFISTLLVLAAALSLRSWLNRIMSIFPRYRNVAGDFAVIFWLAMPWMLGETAWPTQIHNVGAQIIFTELARLLLVRERLTAGLAALVTAGIVGSSLFCEAFYFAIIPVVVFYSIAGRGPAKTRRELAALVGICGLAQAIAIAFNRYCAYLGAGPTNKRFNHYWLQWAIGNLLAMPNALLNSFPEYRLLGLVLAVLVVACALSLWAAGRHIESEPLFRTYLVGLMAVAIATLLLSDAIYSAAGYGIASLGGGTRTFYAASVSFTIAFFALICTGFIPGARAVKTAMLAASAGLVLVLALAQHHRVEEWGYAWREELRILRDPLVDEINRLPVPAAILYAGPYQYHGMVIFGTQWDLTAAVASRSLNENRRPFQSLHAIYPAGDQFTWSWDGTTLWKKQSGRRAQRISVQQLYLWRDGAPSLERVAKGFRWPPA